VKKRTTTQTVNTVCIMSCGMRSFHSLNHT